MCCKCNAAVAMCGNVLQLLQHVSPVSMRATKETERRRSLVMMPCVQCVAAVPMLQLLHCIATCCNVLQPVAT